MKHCPRSLAHVFTAAALLGAASCTSSGGGSTPAEQADAAAPSPSSAIDASVDARRAADSTADASTSDALSLDPNADNDGDGYLFADDCNDADPLVNPGAFEVPGDHVDNDCDGQIDEVVDCDTMVGPDLYKTADTSDFVHALGICQSTTKDAKGKERRWGVLSASLARTDGTAITGPSVVQYGVLPNFGQNVAPRAGKNVVVLSSGTARTPGLQGFQSPRDNPFISGVATLPPSGYPMYACYDGDSDPIPFSDLGGKVLDSVVLTIEMRVPTNAQAFRYNVDFYTSEFRDRACANFNDTFLALLTSKAGRFSSALHDNVAFSPGAGQGAFPLPGAIWPVDSSSALLGVCNGAAGSGFPCAFGGAELVGTGFEDVPDPTQNAATGWLENVAPVWPGETMKIKFVIFDVPHKSGGGADRDSTVLLDNWRWDTAGAGPLITR